MAKKRDALLVGLAAAVLGVILLGRSPYSQKSSPNVNGAASPMVSAASRPLAPDFTLGAVNGGGFQLSSLKGKHPVLINFFATW